MNGPSIRQFAVGLEKFGKELGQSCPRTQPPSVLLPVIGLASRRQLEDSHGLVVVSKRRASSLGQQLRLVVPLFTCVPPPVS